MVTASPAPGMAPFDQSVPVFQSPLTPDFQLIAVMMPPNPRLKYAFCFLLKDIHDTHGFIIKFYVLKSKITF
jgi:hypothetical protein